MRILSAILGFVIITAGAVIGSHCISNANPNLMFQAFALGASIMIGMAIIGLMFITNALKPEKPTRVRRIISYDKGKPTAEEFDAIESAVRSAPSIGVATSKGRTVCDVHYIGV